MPHKGKAGALRARIADVGSVGVAGIIIAITGFVIIAGLAKVLDPTLNAEFMVFWSVLFWAFGAMNGIQFETVRAVKAGRVADAGQLDGGRGGRRARAETVNGRGAPVLTVVSVWTAGVGVLLAATSPLWGRAVFQDQPTLSGIVVAVGVAGFTLYSGLVGVANGNGHWRAGAVLSSLEALFRLIAIAAVTLVVWHLGGRLLLPIKAAASVGAILTCVVAFAGWKPARRAARARADVPTGRFSGQLGRSVVANLAGCALTVGYPTVMSLMVSKTAIAHAAGLLFAISMTRALLLLPLNVFQPMLISHFVSARGHGTKLLAALWGIVAGAGAVIAAAVALIGPFLLRLLAKDYQLSPGLLAALTLGAAAVTLAVATGALALSLGAHTAYMVGWIVAVAVSAAALALPLPLNTATVVSLLIGPVVGALIHSAAIARRLRVPMAEA